MEDPLNHPGRSGQFRRLALARGAGLVLVAGIASSMVLRDWAADLAMVVSLLAFLVYLIAQRRE